MADIIATLSTFPGIEGLCLLQSGHEAKVGGSGMKTAQLQDLAMQAAILFKMGASEEFALQNVKFRFEQHNIIALTDSTGAILLIASEPQANTSLIVNAVSKMFGNRFV
jgi:hypothetical protein